MIPMMEWLIAFVTGLAIGSFLNVCIARLPARESVVSPRSRCPSCRRLIAWYDNIPLVSYLALGARCRGCRKPISGRYPAVEAFTGIVSLLLALKYGLTAEWAIYLMFASAMIVLLLIDLDHRILPDVITLNGIWVGFAASLYLAHPSGLATRFFAMLDTDVSSPRVLALTGSVFGVLFGGGLLWAVREAFFLLRGIEGMGFGDVKMMAMVGAFLGLPLTLLTILVGSVAGSVLGLAFIRLSGKERGYELPFGTFLGIGAVIAVLYGNDLLGYYFENVFPRGV